MNATLHIVSSTPPTVGIMVLKPTSPQLPQTKTATHKPALTDDERRAREIGPVLEEILHASWNRWEIH